MPKQLTASQILGEIGENAARGRFLTIGFQFDGRSRLEAGVDGIAEVMIDGQPLAKMIAVQVKATEAGSYASETDEGFSYLVRQDDLEYWRGSNLPVVIVLYRRSDESFYWKEVSRGVDQAERRLQFDKSVDVLDHTSVNRLANLTVPTKGFGYYVPPLGGGEEALVNLLPIELPTEVFTASTPYDARKAMAILFDGHEPPRFDWIIRNGTFWSFHDPRTSCCREIIDHDQVDAIDTEAIAFPDDVDEEGKFIHLLRETLRHQTREDLTWSKSRKILYFSAIETDATRNYSYVSSKQMADADVVAVTMSDKEPGKVSFVRHHAFAPRFERLAGQWYLVVTPTYYFTTNGLVRHPKPAGLLAGKKRLDKSSALRGQVIMWHRFLSEADRAGVSDADTLFGAAPPPSGRLRFGPPPTVQLETRVPEDGWGGGKKKVEVKTQQEGLFA